MPKHPVTWRDHLRYRFENTLSKGTIAIIAWLALASSVIVVIAALTLTIFGIRQNPDDPTSNYSLIEGAWQGLMHALDSGNLAGDAGWPLRILMFVVTLAGIFLVSILIGTITSGMEAKLDELRKGRSRVLENDYTLILGWSSKIYSIIGELIIANSNQKKPRIVILADRDKVEMEDDIRAKFESTGNTVVICRSGDPLDLDDLEVVDPHSARSIVVLAPETDNPDIHVIKSVLAITNNPNRKSEPYHVVAEIREERNMEAARLVGGQEAIFVQGEDLIARVTAQTCRQSGLSVVYTELLDFDGAEIYFSNLPELDGRTYRETLSSFEESAVIGLMRADGEVLINPPMTTRLRADDQVIAISEDDDTVVVSTGKSPAADIAAMRRGKKTESKPERTLILGWNEKALAIVRELDNYVAPGSELIAVCQREGSREQLLQLTHSLAKMKVRFSDNDITNRAVLEALNPETFDHIILMSYSHLPIQEADAQTLITLLHLRAIADQKNVDMSIVSEMMDLRNRALAQVAKADDFIVSDKLVSLMLAQLSENKDLEKVFKILFSAEGSEIYVRPITDYVATGVPVDFYTVMESAAERGETAIGYRIVRHSNDKDQGYGVKVNPKKSDKITFAAEDRIVVLAED